MNEEAKIIVELTKANAVLTTYFKVLATRVDEATKSGHHFIDIDDIKPIMQFVHDKDLDVINFGGKDDEQMLDKR
jgi:hypothetical protein